ncbi:MAG: SemiSWEET transporter [Saprospiraceae bacterium]|nr:SemiSWEET transporter [Saprospiraceae bacterium]
MTGIMLLGLIAACLTTGAFLPQAIQTWKTRSTEDISLGMYSMMFTGILCWLVYGIMKQDLPIILANSVASVLSFVILFIKIKGILKH